MRESRIQPTGVERTFSESEIIVSKTDPRGIITYANNVFLRVSAYREDELVGRPHNVIRHPHMPRAVFQLLWETIAQGREIFAYVNNLAADGAHYWVLAHITPSFDSAGRIIGYHSNRRRPGRAAVDTIAPLYAALVDEEHRHQSPTAAMAASRATLEGELTRRGQTYEEFVWTVINGPSRSLSATHCTPP